MSSKRRITCRQNRIELKRAWSDGYVSLLSKKIDKIKKIAVFESSLLSQFLACVLCRTLRRTHNYIAICFWNLFDSLHRYMGLLQYSQSDLLSCMTGHYKLSSYCIVLCCILMHFIIQELWDMQCQSTVSLVTRWTLLRVWNRLAKVGLISPYRRRCIRISYGNF